MGTWKPVATGPEGPEILLNQGLRSLCSGAYILHTDFWENLASLGTVTC